jgi:hypothetical protein
MEAVATLSFLSFSPVEIVQLLSGCFSRGYRVPLKSIKPQ